MILVYLIMEIQELLNLAVRNKASDLHLLAGVPPTLRIDGVLRYVTTYTSLKGDDIESMVFS